MERFNAKLSNSGTTIHTDSTIRLQTRPTISSQALRNNKNAFGDIGSSLNDNIPKNMKRYQSAAKGKRQKRPVVKDRDHDDSVDDSSDPLASSFSEAYPVSPANPKKRAAYVDSDGKEHAYVSGYGPEKSKALKNLKFNKRKPGKEETSAVEKSSQENVDSKLRSPPHLLDKAKSNGASSSRSRAPKHQNIRSGSPETVPKLRPRPRPRPTVKAQPKTFLVDFTETRTPPSITKAGGKSKKRTEAIEIDDSSNSEHDEMSPNLGSSPKLVPKAFPMILSPPSSQIVSGPSSGDKSKPAPFPMPLSNHLPTSPIPEKRKKATVKPFPMSPRVFLAEKGKGKQKETSLFSDDEEPEEPDAGRPFPLQSQFFNSSPTSSPHAYRKRHSESRRSSDDEKTPRKKQRESLGTQLLFDEGDSLFISPDIDPKTLCPYCDVALPSSPSPLLLKLLKTAAKNSAPDPRPANPLGRKAPFARYISVCQRHQFESQILPEAEQKGWPKTINWTQLGPRIEKMKGQLQEIINDAEDEVQVVDDEWDSTATGARSKSVFWQEVISAVKRKGARAAAGVKDQFLNFQKIQPGYYGELGSVIIHQTLYDMFPPSSLHKDVIAPLSHEEFMQRILVPEVALRLIMEDRKLTGKSGGAQNALTILRESSAYGVAMFPADAGEEGAETSRQKKYGEGIAAGERIVMERARKRRKEIEEEEKREQEEKRMAAANAPRPRPRPRPLKSGASKSSVMNTDTDGDSLFVPRMPTCEYDTDQGDLNAEEPFLEAPDVLTEEDVLSHRSMSPNLTDVDVNIAPSKRNKRQTSRSSPRSSFKPERVSDDESDSRKTQTKSTVSRTASWQSHRTSDMDISSSSSSDLDKSSFSSKKTPDTKTPKLKSHTRSPSVVILGDNSKTPRPKPAARTTASISTSLDDLPPLDRARALRLEGSTGAPAAQPKASSSRGGGKKRGALATPSSSHINENSSPIWMRSMHNGFVDTDSEESLSDSRAPLASEPRSDPNDWLLRDVSSQSVIEEISQGSRTSSSRRRKRH